MVPAHHRQERRFFHYQPQERITQKYPGRKHLSPHGCPARYRRCVPPAYWNPRRAAAAIAADSLSETCNDSTTGPSGSTWVVAEPPQRRQTGTRQTGTQLASRLQRPGREDWQTGARLVSGLQHLPENEKLAASTIRGKVGTLVILLVVCTMIGSC